MSIRADDAIVAPWWPELLAVKDTHTYEALAERFGLTVTSLRRALELAGETKVSMPRGRKLGVPQPRSATVPGDAAPVAADPLDRVRADVGRIPDAEVAGRAGVTVEDVKEYRREHGIAPFLRPPPGFAQPPKSEPPAGQPWTSWSAPADK